MFVPFAGCPNRCVFCDQHSITGRVKPTTPEDVKQAVETALASGGIDANESEIAFFGGSFTALHRDYMISLLEATKDYIDKFKGIRISTRPDAIDEEILTILKQYKVTAIELGAQSMKDVVLELNNRGHNSKCVIESSELIKKFGFSLGLQMMTGLYGSTTVDDIYTACEFVKLEPDTVRIYPTVVLENTELERIYNKGFFFTETLQESINLCIELIQLFEENNISVIRVGLHSSETMQSKIVAGAYHPAFRELCENQIFLYRIMDYLEDNQIKKGNITVYVAPDAVSKATGQKKKNIISLLALGYKAKFVQDSKLSGRQIIIQEG